MKQVWLTLSQDLLCSDKISPNTNPKVEEIRKEYDRKLTKAHTLQST